MRTSTRPPRPKNRRHPWRSLTRAASWHRRKLAVLAAVAAVLTGLSAAAPAAPPTVFVVRTRVGVAGGAVLARADLEIAAIPPAGVPEGAATELDRLVGQTLAAPVPKGAILTPLALSGARAAVGPGQVVAPVRIADAGLVRLLRPGDIIDVVAADPQERRASVAAAGVRVITIPAVAAADDDPTSSGALVLIAADRSTATRLAQAAASGTLSVIWR